MPEISLGHNAFFEEVTNTYKIKKNEIGSLHAGEIKPIAEAHTDMLLGVGDENVVIAHGTDQVSALSYHGMSVYDAKKYYYTHRVIHYLLPNNFPRVCASFGEISPHAGQLSGTIRKRVYPHQTAYKPSFSLDDAYQKYRTIPINPAFQTKNSNIMIGVNGGEYYVDEVRLHEYGAPKNDLIEKKDNILKFMRKNNYAAQDIYKVRKSLERLDELQSERDLQQAA